VLAGWWLAIMHITAAAALAITIIGIPFAWAHVKLALASLFPVGKTVVEVDELRLLPGDWGEPRLAQHAGGMLRAGERGGAAVGSGPPPGRAEGLRTLCRPSPLP
jgi:hypothetical protein